MNLPNFTPKFWTKFAAKDSFQMIAKVLFDLDLYGPGDSHR